MKEPDYEAARRRYAALTFQVVPDEKHVPNAHLRLWLCDRADAMRSRGKDALAEGIDRIAADLTAQILGNA